jgi:hypothetical protein
MRACSWALGQRVFVQVDWRGNPVGAAGTVVGLRRDDAAWVRLDQRPEGCRAHFLFHEEDPRGSDLIAYPGGCIASCLCGAPVVGAGIAHEGACWCSECHAFVEAIIRTRGDERFETLQGRLLLPEAGVTLEAFLDHISRSFTEQAMARSAGNKARAARLLGLNRTTLVERLKRMGAE